MITADQFAALDRSSVPAIIATLPSDVSRARYCRAMAERARLDYAQGRRECVERQIERYRRSHGGREPWLTDYAACVATGRERWSSHPTARHLIEDDQWFSRMANDYANGVTANPRRTWPGGVNPTRKRHGVKI